MKTIFLAVALTGENNPTTEEFIKNAKEQISFKYDAESFDIKALTMQESIELSTSGLVLPSEAVFAILSVLSTQNEKVVLSKSKFPERAVELAKQLIVANEWAEPRPGWETLIEFPSILEEINNKKREMVGRLFQLPAEPPKPLTAEETLQNVLNTATAGGVIEGAIDPNSTPVAPQPSAFAGTLAGMTEEQAAQAAKMMAEVKGDADPLATNAPNAEIGGLTTDGGDSNAAPEDDADKDPFNQ